MLEYQLLAFSSTIQIILPLFTLQEPILLLLHLHSLKYLLNPQTISFKLKTNENYQTISTSYKSFYFSSVYISTQKKKNITNTKDLNHSHFKKEAAETNSFLQCLKITIFFKKKYTLGSWKIKTTLPLLPHFQPKAHPVPKQNSRPAHLPHNQC